MEIEGERRVYSRCCQNEVFKVRKGKSQTVGLCYLLTSFRRWDKSFSFSKFSFGKT